MKTKLFLTALFAIICLVCLGCDEDDDDCYGCYDTGQEGYEFLSISTNIPQGIYEIRGCEDNSFVDYGPATKGSADLGTDFNLPAAADPGICYMIKYAVITGYEAPPPEKAYLILGTPLEIEGEYTSSD
jgi:hypothetical protein